MHSSVDPVRLVLDDRPSSYSDPCMRYKTTRRKKYDDARSRRGEPSCPPFSTLHALTPSPICPGATLHPSDAPDAPPFDAILWNAKGEVTETTIANIAFRFRDRPHEPYLTPRTECGLLQGVMRSELLEIGSIQEATILVEEVKKAARVSTLCYHQETPQLIIARLQDNSLSVICFNAVRGIFSAYVAIDDSV